MMMYWDNGWMHGYGFLPMIIFMIVLIVVIVLVVKLLSSKNGVVTAGPESAMEILKKRYAKGEITEEQYEKMKEKLK